MSAARFPERLASPYLSGMLRIWPPTTSEQWSTNMITDHQIHSLINLLPNIRDTHGIPVDELSHRRIERIKARMRKRGAADGFDPSYAIVNRLISQRPQTDLIEGEFSPWPRQ